jgi:hypothetical protein
MISPSPSESRANSKRPIFRVLSDLWRERRFGALWWIGFGLFVLSGLFPIKTTITRSVTLVLAAGLWLALPKSFPRRLAGSSAFLAIFVAVGLAAWLPGRPINPVRLQDDYVGALSSYRNTLYVWGGESRLGVDCSGLVRIAMVDACAWEALRTHNAGLIRRAAWIWWHDCSAADLGDGYSGNTVPVESAKKLSAADPGELRPGDMAVLADGLHVMAYLGDGRWIEADPRPLRVVVYDAAGRTDVWSNMSVRIVRWKDFGH